MMVLEDLPRNAMQLAFPSIRNVGIKMNINSIMVQNEFGIWVHDIFAEWLSIHIQGQIIDLNPIHNAVPIDIFAVALMGIANNEWGGAGGILAFGY
jgi:hypothetical protein